MKSFLLFHFLLKYLTQHTKNQKKKINMEFNKNQWCISSKWYKNIYIFSFLFLFWYLLLFLGQFFYCWNSRMSVFCDLCILYVPFAFLFYLLLSSHGNRVYYKWIAGKFPLNIFRICFIRQDFPEFRLKGFWWISIFSIGWNISLLFPLGLFNLISISAYRVSWNFSPFNTLLIGISAIQCYKKKSQFSIWKITNFFIVMHLFCDIIFLGISIFCHVGKICSEC